LQYSSFRTKETSQKIFHQKSWPLISDNIALRFADITAKALAYREIVFLYFYTMITFKTRELLSALKTIAPAIKPNSVLPILEYILVTIENNVAEIRATDLQIEISVTIQNTSDNVKFALDFAEFSRLLPTLQSEFIELRIGKKIELVSGKDKFSFSYTDASVFPAPKEMSKNALSIDVQQDFIDSIKEAAKHDPKDAVIFAKHSGCCVNFLADSVEIAGGMNTFYLNELPYKCKGKYHFEPHFIASTKSGGVLMLDEKNVRLICDNVCITSGLSTVDFVDYTRIYPPNIEPNIFFSFSDLLPKLESALSFGDPNFTKVLLTFNTETIDIEYRNDEAGREMISSIPCRNEFGEISVAYNAAFLRNIISSTNQDKIGISVNSDIMPTYIIVPGFKNAISVIQK
jgi:DNA polymerase III sliding clamp (beta) subunit (PCNA family)